MATAQAGEVGAPGTELRRNALSLGGLVVMGIAYMGLALTAYFNFGIMDTITGPVVPLAFLGVTIAMLPTALSYAVMNQRRPTAGSTLTWLWEATVPPLGVWLGWVLVVTYVVGSILQPVMFGLFSNSLLDYFGIGTNSWTAVIFGLISVAVVAVLTKKDIRVSARITGYFIAVEAGFVLLLALYIIIRQLIDGNLSLEPLNPGAATAGWTGFQNALLLAVLAIAAFDIVAPMAEETKTPRSLVPRATVYVTLGAGLYWIVTSFGIINGADAKTWTSYVSSGEFTPIYLLADHYIGYLRILVPLTGMTAVFAAFTAISVTAARLLFALSREGLAPRAFSQVDENRTPWTAQALVLAACVVLPPLIVLWQHRNPLLGFFWIGVSYVFFVLIPYTLTCVANIFYHFRFHRNEINWLTNLVLPVAGIVINGYIFYKNFLKTYLLDATDFTTQTSIFWVGVVTLIILAVFTYIGISRTGGARQPHHFSETAMGAGD